MVSYYSTLPLKLERLEVPILKLEEKKTPPNSKLQMKIKKG